MASGATIESFYYKARWGADRWGEVPRLARQLSPVVTNKNIKIPRVTLENLSWRNSSL